MIGVEFRRKAASALVFLGIMLAMLIFSAAAHDFLIRMMSGQLAAMATIPDGRPGKSGMMAALQAILSGDIHHYLYYQWISRGYLQTLFIFAAVTGVFDTLSDRTERTHFFSLNYVSRRRHFTGKSLSGWAWIGILAGVSYIATILVASFARWQVDPVRLFGAFAQIGLTCLAVYQLLMLVSLFLRGKGSGYWTVASVIVLALVGLFVFYESVPFLTGRDAFIEGKADYLYLAGTALAAFILLSAGVQTARHRDA